MAVGIDNPHDVLLTPQVKLFNLLIPEWKEIPTAPLGQRLRDSGGF
jgi:hypothetical protein